MPERYGSDVGSPRRRHCLIIIQLAYALGPIFTTGFGLRMTESQYSDATVLMSQSAWASFFVLTHGFALLAILRHRFRTAGVTLIASVCGYATIMLYAREAPLGAIIAGYSLSPNMLLNIYVIAVCFSEYAFKERQHDG